MQTLSGTTLGYVGAIRDSQQPEIDKIGEKLFGENYTKPTEADPILEANRAVQRYAQEHILPENMNFPEKVSAGVGSVGGAIAAGFLTGKLFGGSFPSGAAVAKAIPGGAKLMQTFPKVGAALEAASGERIIVALSGGMAEGMSQASAVYEKALHETGDREIAGNAMTKTLLANIPLNAITNVIGYGDNSHGK